MKIAGVVVLYEPTNEDIKNIDSYISNLDILYVIDNSKNTNLNRIPQYKKIKYIFNDNNYGIATPLNSAADLAKKEGYKWLLTMDQDTYFNKNVLNLMIEKIKNTDCSQIGIVTPWHKTKLKTKKSKEKIDYPLDVMTSGNLVNIDILEDLGGFKEWLFIDGVDIEYCLNLNKHKYKIMRLNDLEINHNLGDIFYRKFLWKDLLITNHSAMRRYYQVRNYFYIRDMYYDCYPKFCKKLVKFKTIILGIIFFEKNKISKLKAIHKGYWDYKRKKKGRSYE